jgi:release factor glutamine methyltransferase
MEYDGLKFEIFPSVYEPAEDSFLLAKHAKKLRGRILEIGCGCALASLVNAKQNPRNNVLGVDINAEAVRCAAENAKKNRIKNARFFVSDLFSAIPKNEKFDAIIFNPPYLPTTKSEKLKGKINAAFDGGNDGRKILDRFLNEFERYLKSDGVILLIHSSLNDLEKTKRKLTEKGFKIEILEEERFFFEKIYVLRARKFFSASNKQVR